MSCLFMETYIVLLINYVKVYWNSNNLAYVVNLISYNFFYYGQYILIAHDVYKNT